MANHLSHSGHTGRTEPPDKPIPKDHPVRNLVLSLLALMLALYGLMELARYVFR